MTIRYVAGILALVLIAMVGIASLTTRDGGEPGHISSEAITEVLPGREVEEGMNCWDSEGIRVDWIEKGEDADECAFVYPDGRVRPFDPETGWID